MRDGRPIIALGRAVGNAREGRQGSEAAEKMLKIASMAARIVKVLIDGQQEHLVPVGTPLMALVGRRDSEGRPILGAVLNNRLVSLSTPIRGAARLRPVTEMQREGTVIYRRSISIVLLQAVHEAAPEGRLSIGQSLGEGYFFEWIGPALSEPRVREFEARMRQIVAEDRPFVEEQVDIDEAIELFAREGAQERVRLLRTLRVTTVPVVSCGDLHILAHGPVAPAAGGLEGFELALYNGGLILRFPGPSARGREVADMPRLFKVYRDTRRWN